MFASVSRLPSLESAPTCFKPRLVAPPPPKTTTSEDAKDALKEKFEENEHPSELLKAVDANTYCTDFFGQRKP